MAERRLGRGLDGLLKSAVQDVVLPVAAGLGQATTVATDHLEPNPQQPRQGFAKEELDGLSQSIREHGVLQPIVVRRRGDRYQIVAGERRFRAAVAAGLREVPVVIRDVPDEQMLELALVENLQREDLDPIEKARSFKAYLSATGKTQEAASERLGLDRSTIANMIRLLDLPEEVQTLVRKGMVSMGHAKALLSLSSRKKQIDLAARVAREGLSVRQVEKIVSGGGSLGARKRPAQKVPEIRDLEARLRERLGTKVTVEEGGKPGSGRIVIEFYCHDDLERILRLFQ